MSSSIETTVKQWADQQIRSLGWNIIASENQTADSSIDDALKNNPSKKGGDGGGRPDYTIILDNGDKTIPVFVEYKGTKGKLEKLDEQKLVILRGNDGKFDFNKSIPNYAVNGASYYAMNILKSTDYNESLAVGVNGSRDSSGKVNYEIKCYVLNTKDPELPIFFGDFNDFDFLKNDAKHKKNLFQKITDVQMDPDELEQRLIRDDSKIESVLQELNQKIHDEQQIIPSQRINIVAGSLMAAVGVMGKDGNWKVSRLNPSELTGSIEEGNTDGEKIITKVHNFLKERSLPEPKQESILSELKRSFVQNNLNYKSINETQTPIKEIYTEVYEKLIPIYDITGTNDFTGKLFNVMNAWVDIPDGGANDVVLTPRYITSFMANLAQVNKDSYVWDWALGSGGFLISAMNIMIEDAREFYSNDLSKQYKKIEDIKTKQLLGVELLSNVYILAVLNMILMGDGSSNIVNDDSLLNYDGKYAYNDNPFPANVFLLNPPYSAEGNGMIFVEKAFKKQNSGYGAVIIQDSAGNGKATDINKRILKNNRLKASIKMPHDLFKANVQTSIYLFEVGKQHKLDDNVFFFDLRDDGYTRTNRRRAKVNLFNSNDAKGHYKEVVDIILNKSKKTNYFVEDDNYYIGTINPDNGNDWNYDKKIDITPDKSDFKRTISDYLSWELSNVIKNDEKNLFDINLKQNYYISTLTSKEKETLNDLINDNFKWKEFNLEDLFGKSTRGKRLKALDRISGDIPFVTAGELNQGVSSFIGNDIEIFPENTTTIDMFGSAKYRNYDYGADDHIAVVHTDDLPEYAAIFVSSAINKSSHSGKFDYSRNFYAKDADSLTIKLPVNDNNDEPDYEKMEILIRSIEKEYINKIINWTTNKNFKVNDYDD